MADGNCRKCGTPMGSTERFCRKCGFPQNGTEEITPEDIPLVIMENFSVRERIRLHSQKTQKTKQSLLKVIAGVSFLLLLLILIIIVFKVFLRQSNNQPIISIEIVETPSTYPTPTPYFTATPFRIPPEYPTATPYPITGILWQMPLDRFNFSVCHLSIENFSPFQDTVVVLTTVETNTVFAMVFVRANDSFILDQIPRGNYYTYVALGYDWDVLAERFKKNASYFRFKGSNYLSSCSSYPYSYLEVTINGMEGAGSEIMNVLPESFLNDSQ